MLCVIAKLDEEANERLASLRDAVFPGGSALPPLYGHITLATYLPEEHDAFVRGCGDILKAFPAFTVRYERVGYFQHHGYLHGGIVLAGIAVVKTVDVGDEHQRLCIHQIGDNSGKIVVVAYIASGQLVNGDRVVFVDDGDDSHIDQSGHAVNDILSVMLVFHIIAGEKHLRCLHAVFGKNFVVEKHQLTLAHGSHCLTACRIGGSLLKSHLAYAHSQSAGGDKNDLSAAVAEVAYYAAKVVDAADIGLAVFICKGGCPHLDDNALRALYVCQMDFAPRVVSY